MSSTSSPATKSGISGLLVAGASSSSQTLSPPLGGLVQTLKTDDLLGNSKEFVNSATIQDAKTITSYNWVDKSHKTGGASTILIPGKPPLWTPPTIPSRLSEDSGTYYRDKNAARYPKHPVEPAVVACLASNPNLPTEIDVMACGSTIGNLLRFVSGQDKQFRILVEKVAKTVFFIRRENSPTEVISGIRGFGHTFPEAYTTWEPDVKGSNSHQRLIRYEFGCLKFVVRFEGDGYINTTPNLPQLSTAAKAKQNSVDDLITYLSDVRIPSEVQSCTTLQVSQGGKLVDQKCIFDLKTRSVFVKYKKNHVAEELPRLWVAQIPTLILAFHKAGFFRHEEIQIRDVRRDVSQWESSHASELARLAAAIHKIIKLVSDAPGNKLELRCHEAGKLEVREQLPDAGDVLSPEIKARWEKYSALLGRPHGDFDDMSDPDGSSESGDGYQVEWDDGSEKDFTACSSQDCGYCGHCPY